MIRKFLKYSFLLTTILGALLTLALFLESFWLGIIALIPTLICGFAFLIFKDENFKFNTNNIEIQSQIEFDVAGTFLGGRQANIGKFFYKKLENGDFEEYEGLKKDEFKTNENLDIEIYQFPQDYEIEDEYPSKIIRLEKEPENEYDKNAIKVMIKGMGTVGYVPKNLNILIAKMIDENKITKIKASVVGGPYKLWNGKRLKEDREDFQIKIRLY